MWDSSMFLKLLEPATNTLFFAMLSNFIILTFLVKAVPPFGAFRPIVVPFPAAPPGNRGKSHEHRSATEK